MTTVTWTHWVRFWDTEFEIEVDWIVSGDVVAGPTLNHLAVCKGEPMDAWLWPTAMRFAALNAVCQDLAGDDSIHDSIVQHAEEIERSIHWEHRLNRQREESLEEREPTPPSAGSTKSGPSSFGGRGLSPQGDS